MLGAWHRVCRLVLAVVLVCGSGPPVSAEDHRPANHLAGAASPYLLQHLYNPVDWYPWGEQALELARRENKPIFVSVGYSSCHWCHVMAEESFEDEEIAALLNRDFVSIKIDRETRPDLDARFMLVTELLAGSAGWPNSVFLTPDGNPFFAGGYYPPDSFATLIGQLSGAWADNPALLSGEAEKVAAVVEGHLSRVPTGTRALTPADLTDPAQSILPMLDPFEGGLGVAPKFPNEPLFLFLLDQAQRDGDPRLLSAVTQMLDGMIRGGIHDHVGGGFHRYAIDPDWITPHFEKMLYTQALTGRLMVRAWVATGEPRYRRAAERTFDYVLDRMTDPGGGFYSSEDADSIGPDGRRHEGLYYTWDYDAVASLEAVGPLLARVFGVEAGGNFEGRNILALSEDPDDIAGDLGLTPGQLQAQLDEALKVLAERRDPSLRPFRDEKIILSWNGLMIETLAEAATILDRSDYLVAADTAAEFLWTELGPNEDLNRIHFEGKPSQQALLSDYAAFGLGLIALHDAAARDEKRRLWLDRAALVASAMMARFGTDHGLFQEAGHQSQGPAAIPLDDTMLPSGNAMALALLSRLADRVPDPVYRQEADLLARLLGGAALEDPIGRASVVSAIGDELYGETGPVRHVASGAVRVRAHPDRNAARVTFGLAIADGWHINASEPLEDYLIPTRVTGDSGHDLAARYPLPLIKNLSFSENPLALYEGLVRIDAPLPVRRPGRITLTLQSCSDEVCLPPEELTFTFW